MIELMRERIMIQKSSTKKDGQETMPLYGVTIINVIPM